MREVVVVRGRERAVTDRARSRTMPLQSPRGKHRGIDDRVGMAYCGSGDSRCRTRWNGKSKRSWRSLIATRREAALHLSEKAPVSILSRRKRQPGPLQRATRRTGGIFDGINPTTLLFAGAGTMVAGLDSLELLWTVDMGFVRRSGALPGGVPMVVPAHPEDLGWDGR